MTETQSSRFKDALWFPKEETIVLIGGAGGIGSWLTILLARAGFVPMVYDFDVLEEHNMGGQLYPKRHINKTKVEALKEIIKDFTETDMVANNQKVDTETMSHIYVFSAFDNMQARKDMFASWETFVKEWADEMAETDDEEHLKKLKSQEPIFIDGRLTMEQLQIFCVTPDKIEEYKKHLFDDTEVPDAPCTLKQTSHSAAMIAAHMTGFFTNHLVNINEEDRVRSLPFKWEYFIPLSLVTEE